MELAAELGIGWRDAVLVVISAVGIYATVVLLSRIFGQRSFAQASSFDLALVVGLGTLIGRVVLVKTSLAGGALGLLTMFSLHAALNRAHHRLGWVHAAVENPPVLLVADGEFLDENLHYAHSSRSEVYAEVRVHGYGSMASVRSVVLEASGKMSVIPADAQIDRAVFEEVLGNERLSAFEGR